MAFTNCKPLGATNDLCKATHYLAAVKADFAKVYEGRHTPTTIFPSLCEGCLLAKYGLYEAYEKDASFNLANCNFPHPKNIEGPYLKAFKPSDTLNGDAYVVFVKGDIILPVGQLLVDVLSSYSDFVFTKDNQGPSIQITSSKGPRQYRLNPNLYSYFRSLRDRHHKPFNINNLIKRFSILEQMMIKNMHKIPDKQMLCHESDMFIFGNLLTPDSIESHFVRGVNLVPKGEPAEADFMFEIKKTKPGVNVVEKMMDSKSHYVTLRPHETLQRVKDIEEANDHQIRHMNSIIKPFILDVRQAIVNSKPFLSKYFGKSDNRSAVDLYVSSFCYPNNVGDPADADRFLLENCSYVEGVGLVATGTICNNDFLVIDKSVNVPNLIKLKMCNPENMIEYSIDKLDMSGPRPKEVPCIRGIQDTSDNIPSQRSLLYNSIMMR